jgi:hypothetical protein
MASDSSVCPECEGQGYGGGPPRGACDRCGGSGATPFRVRTHDLKTKGAMKAVTIKPREFIPKGHIYLMPDTSHPEIDMWVTIEDADALILVCHPDHEQLVRDAVAMNDIDPIAEAERRGYEDGPHQTPRAWDLYPDQTLSARALRDAYRRGYDRRRDAS